MMMIPIYQVDAFTSVLFSGNPAAVCPLENWISDQTMQEIAKENNLSETAFFVIEKDEILIRWFSPKREIDLAGHPTLAAAHVLFNELQYDEDVVSFSTKIGDILEVRSKEDILMMDFPSRPPELLNEFCDVAEALRSRPSSFLFARDGVAVFDREDDIRKLNPDMEKVSHLPYDALIVTAPGNKVDFVSRFFAPNLGIPEDPVTGSAHCELIPFWAGRLNKKEMIARQISNRGGELFCSYEGERVKIGGQAVTYMRGEIQL